MPKNYVHAMYEKARQSLALAEKESEKARTENRLMTADEKSAAERHMQDCNDYQSQAKAYEDQSKAKLALEAMGELKSIALFDTGGAGNAPNFKDAYSPMDRMGNAIFSEEKAFHNFLRFGKNGLTPQERKYISSTSDADGGAVVTHEISQMLITKMQQESQIRQRSTVIPMTGASMTIPAFYNTDDPAIYAQNGTIAETNLSGDFGKILLVPEEIKLLWGAPRSWLEDTPSKIASILAENFAYRFALKEEYYFLNGTGVNQPKGLLQTTGFDAHDVETTTSDTIIADDLVDIPLMLEPQYRRNAVWIVPTGTMQQIVKLRTREAGDSTGNFLWQPSFSATLPNTMLGYPIIECPQFAEPTVDGDPLLMFGDLRTYFIGDRINMEIQVLDELLALYGRVGYLMRKRVDATPTDANAFVRLNRT